MVYSYHVSVASVLDKLILAINEEFTRGKFVHPLTAEKENPGSYALWEYDLAKKTLEYFPEEFVKPENFKDKKILDLCCGAGGKSVLISEMGAREVVGVDIDDQFIKMAKKFASKKNISNCRFETGDARELKFEDNSFDYVFSFDALEHVDPPEEMIAEARRVLKPGGKLIMSFTNWERHDGHHMTDAIRFPWLHLLISEKRLVRLYRGLVDDGMFVLRAGSLSSKKIAYVNKLKLRYARKIIKKSNMKTLLYEEILYPGIISFLARMTASKRFITRIITTVMEVSK